MSSEDQLRPSRGLSGIKRLVLPVSIVVGFVVLCALGSWQVHRLHWKNDLIARVELRSKAAPKSIDSIDLDNTPGEQLDYVPAFANGTFLHDHETYFFATHKGTTGWFVYTPLQRADGTFLIVNRGFVPYEMKEPSLRSEGQIADSQLVVGLLRQTLARKPGRFLPDNEPNKNIFYWKDIKSMAQTSGLDVSKVLPVFLDASDVPNPGGFPIGGVTRMSFPNNHLQYAITWFGLAAALLCVGASFMWTRRRGNSISERVPD